MSKPNSSQVDDFGIRLSNELSALSWQDRNDLLMRIGRMELRMRGDGQYRPIWRGPLPEAHMLGTNVVVETEQGQQRGRVICFGVVNVGVEYERSVVIRVPASGTQYEAPGSLTRLATRDDERRVAEEIEMAQRLAEATEAVAVSVRSARRKGLKDPELQQRMLTLAKAHANVRTIVESTVNYKLSGRDPSKRVYLFRSQLRVDLSGFSLTHPGVRNISDDEAREMHLGKVRGQLIFDDSKQAFSAFEAALEMLK